MVQRSVGGLLHVVGNAEMSAAERAQATEQDAGRAASAL